MVLNLVLRAPFAIVHHARNVYLEDRRQLVDHTVSLKCAGISIDFVGIKVIVERRIKVGRALRNVNDDGVEQLFFRFHLVVPPRKPGVPAIKEILDKVPLLTIGADAGRHDGALQLKQDVSDHFRDVSLLGDVLNLSECDGLRLLLGTRWHWRGAVGRWMIGRGRRGRDLILLVTFRRGFTLNRSRGILVRRLDDIFRRQCRSIFPSRRGGDVEHGKIVTVFGRSILSSFRSSVSDLRPGFVVTRSLF